MLKLPRLRAKVRKAGTFYWFDHGGCPRVWEPLGKDEQVVLRRYNVLMEGANAAPGTVDAMIGDCLDTLAGKIAPGTMLNYRSYRKHLARVFPGYPQDITQAQVRKYLLKCPRSSFRNEIGLLSMAFANWMDEERLEFNPCWGVRVKRAASKRDRLLSDAEIDRIIAKADERLAVAIELAYATGLRIGDVCNLRWHDVAEVVETQKTGQRQRFVSTEAFSALLARCRALQARVGSLYVLCDRRGRKWKDNTLRTHWDKTCEAAGVEDAHFHDLRAAGGTEVDRQGGDAQSFLGHKDARTTAIYLRGKKANVVTPLRRKA